jgi:hypothetical protein
MKLARNVQREREAVSGKWFRKAAVLLRRNGLYTHPKQELTWPFPM